MPRFIIIFSVCLGFVLGWFGREIISPVHNTQSLMHTDSSSNNNTSNSSSIVDALSNKKIIVLSGESNSRTEKTITSRKNEQAIVQEEVGVTQMFIQYLDNREYFEAINFFQEVSENDSSSGNALKKILLTRLALFLDQNQAEDFTEFTNAYLTTYYEDLDVLLMLAEFNRQTEYYIEAIGVFQLAKEYSYSIKDNEKVNKAFSDYLDNVDTYLSDKVDWYTLSQIYLQADIVGLLSPKQRFRQAQVVIANGDIYHGKQILSELLADSRTADDAQKLLAEISDTSSNDIASSDKRSSRFTSAVALNPRGNQYLIDISLGSNTSNTLLIDTGASMTTLSRGAFEDIRSSIDYSNAGARMFSTANGLTKGSVYRVDSFTIGDFKIEDTLVAVLDFEMGGGVHGLLGMNILGNFKFQIEQDKNQLLLEPR